MAKFGWAYAFACDFDTMDVCRPFHPVFMDAVGVAGRGGLFLISGLGRALVGVGRALACRPVRRAS